MYIRRLFYAKVRDFAWLGPVPSAPLNNLAMLTDYITPGERSVACPNQDVVYGAGFLAFDVSPVVVQVPDFGDRFWVCQIVDTRTDASRASVGCTAPRRDSISWSDRIGEGRRYLSPHHVGLRIPMQQQKGRAAAAGHQIDPSPTRLDLPPVEAREKVRHCRPHLIHLAGSSNSADELI